MTVDASRDRLELANQAGCLEEALDAAETIDAQNSLEKMLAHQLAASHRSSMKMTEQLNACLGRMNQGYAERDVRAGHPPGRRHRPHERQLPVRRADIAEAENRRPADGGRAACERERRRSGARRRRDDRPGVPAAWTRRGSSPKMTDEPHAPGWRAALDQARAAPRCGARAARWALVQQPAMRNGRCRLHGGKSTGPRTPEGLARSRRANWKHGYYSAEAKAERAKARGQLAGAPPVAGAGSPSLGDSGRPLRSPAARGVAWNPE